MHPTNGIVDNRDDEGFEAGSSILRAYAETRRFRLGHPMLIRPTPDDQAVLFLRSDARAVESSLYEMNIATGHADRLLTPDQVASGGEGLSAQETTRQQRMRLVTAGFTSYDVSADGRRVVLSLGERICIMDRRSRTVEVLQESGTGMFDPRFSPDGSRVAYVRSHDVYVTELQSGREVAVTTRGSEEVTHGVAEFIAQEEMSRFQGYWWSPDSRLIVFEEADHTFVERFTISDPGAPGGIPSVLPYPRAGRANATVRLGIVAVDTSSSETTWVKWDSERYPYLVRVVWDEAAAPLTIVAQTRDQQEEVVLRVDPRTGDTTVLLVERDESWVDLIAGIPHWLPDTTGFLWASDRSGKRQLELRRATGDVERVLDTGPFPFREIVHVSRELNAVYSITAGPTATSLVCTPLAGDSPTVIVSDTLVDYGAVFSKSGKVYVLSQTSVSGLPTSAVYWQNGQLLSTIPSVGESPAIQPDVEILTVEGAGGRSFVAGIVRPKSFAPGKRYPVVVYVYGGPRVLNVGLDLRAYLLPQWLADHDVIVTMVDNRGTPRRDHSWEHAIRGEFARIPLEDQIEALELIGARYNELDLSRVGVFGFSFGGYVAALATMRRPDVFKVGVAGAPVVDWRDYDSHYTERYLGLPQENVRSYDESSLLSYVSRLERPLMLYHGTADDNVYFFHSLKLIDALFKAGKRFEFLPIVGATHVLVDPVSVEGLYERIAEFLVSNLRNAGDT